MTTPRRRVIQWVARSRVARSRVAHWAAAVAYFVLLAMLSVYQLMFHLTTHLPGTVRQPVTDFYHFHWNYWWIRHALTSPDLNVYRTDYVLAPYTSSFAFHTLALFWFPLWAVIEPVAGTAPAMAAIMVASMALSGLAYFALLREHAVSAGLALVGGSLLALSPIMHTGVFWTNPNLMGWFWPPILLMIWDRIVRADAGGNSRSAALWAALLGGSLYGMTITDLQMLMFVTVLVIPYGLRTLVHTAEVRARWRLFGWAMLAAVVAFALLWFAGPLPYLVTFDRGVVAPMTSERALKIVFPQGFVWHITSRVATVTLGAVVLPLTALMLVLNWIVRRRYPRVWATLPPERWFWLALVPVPLILSAGASIRLFGVEIPMPYQLLHDALAGMFRYPERIAPVIIIPALLFALQTLTPLVAALDVRRRARGARAQVRVQGARLAVPVALLLVVIADARAFMPLDIQPIPTPYAIYEQMGREPYDYVVLEVPTGASSGEGLVGEAEYSTLQWYGTIHGKRMINGLVSRVDTMHYWAIRTDDPALAWLGQRRLLDLDAVRARLRAIIYEYPVGYVVVHTDMIARYTGESTVREVIFTLNSLTDLLCPVVEQGPVVAYRTAWHPDGCPPRQPPTTEPDVYSLDLGSSGDAAFLGAGWWWAEEVVPGVTARWTGDGPTARLWVELPSGAYRVTLAAQAFESDRVLTLRAEGTIVGQATIPASGLADVTFDLPAEYSGRLITLDLDADPSETTMGANPPRTLAIMVDSIRFERVAGP